MGVRQIKPLDGQRILEGGKATCWVLLEANIPGRAVAEFGKVIAMDLQNASVVNGLFKISDQP